MTMALDAEQLALLREWIAEPDESNGWTDQRIESLGPAALLSDGTYDMRLYAAVLWEAKAAEAVVGVDVQESGSTRAMGQVFTHAAKMAERFRAPSVTPSEKPEIIRPQSTRVTRATRG